MLARVENTTMLSCCDCVSEVQTRPIRTLQAENPLPGSKLARITIEIVETPGRARLDLVMVEVSDRHR